MADYWLNFKNLIYAVPKRCFDKFSSATAIAIHRIHHYRHAKDGISREEKLHILNFLL